MVKFLNPLLMVCLLAVTLISLSFGSIDVNAVDALLEWLASVESREALIVGEIRLPRTLLALIVGAAMGLSGAALQGLLRNPLVDPGLIGASQGAALGAALVFYFNLFAGLGVLATPFAGMMGAAITLFILMGSVGLDGAPGDYYYGGPRDINAIQRATGRGIELCAQPLCHAGTGFLVTRVGVKPWIR